MSSIAVLGCMWGDEAKAKIVDFLGEDADVVVRFQGGSNAGHTIYLEGEKYVFHAVPSGILYPKTKCVIAAGVVIDPLGLIAELDALIAKGLSFEGRLMIDERTGIVLPLHRELDSVNEAGFGKIGTTKRGIGPAYADLTARVGVRMIDLKYPEWLAERIRNLYTFHHQSIDDAALAEQCRMLNTAWEMLQSYVCQVDLELHEMRKEGKCFLYEGAQGTLLDISFGTYAYVT
ncbi:MAG: adenylosuccinate synthetase, partial [Candidatus Cloacimonadaceae bacterium]|nr:adenylosuccinate synthetase [Candidatus Cloacimonadaceae bacterium]